MTTTQDHYSVRVWETEKAYKAWTASEDYFFCDKASAERFCKSLRKDKGGAFAFELAWFDEEAEPTTEPFCFWNRKDGLSR